MSRLLSLLVFELGVPQIKSLTMRHALMNLMNTTLFEKYVDQ
jgi:hypothetical protein